MKFIITLILFGIFQLSVAQSHSVSNTVWLYDFGSCKDSIKIKSKNHYQYYSCESRGTTSGNYYFEGDTIVLVQLSGSYDDTFKIDSRHRTPKIKYKLIIDCGKLKFVERLKQDFNGFWIKVNIDFPENYLFRKSSDK